MSGELSNRTATVIGAGVVGACCALQLQRRGVQVTLLDREAPGTQCSFGNAGRIARALCTPRSLPGLLGKVPGMILDPGHPLKIRLPHLLRSLPWFMRFLREGSPKRVEEIADSLHAILSQADRAFDELLGQHDSASLLKRVGAFYVYADEAKAASARLGYEYAVRRGAIIEDLDGDALREIEPAMPMHIRRGFHLPGEAFVLSPLRLTQTVVQRFVEAGGKVLQEEMRDFEVAPSGAPDVMTTGGRLESDTVVVAAGAWSPTIAAKLGVDIPILAERGYHIEIPNSGIELTHSVHFGDQLVSVTPMEHALRAVSGAQFAPVDEPADWRRLKPIVKAVREQFPHANMEGITQWMGPRPSLPDSLPAIGASKKHPDVLFACGHGFVGLTLSAVTGEIVADLATARTPVIDVRAYNPDRFI